MRRIDKIRFSIFKLAWRLNFAGKYMEITRKPFKECMLAADFAIETTEHWISAKPSSYAVWIINPKIQQQFESWKNARTN